MSKKPKRPCCYPLCPKLTEGRYCQIHHKQITRNYDKYARDPEFVSFYKSSAWISTRRTALIRDDYLCQRCLHLGIITPAQMVHHVKEVHKSWEMRLHLDNLISLCDACHNKIHGEGY
ncbi:HNH endonuclease [Paenibacillus caseinilyticus]|uniref:Putative HNH nuclease YajD n=1 Tax=Paenibacillus mucilaginosus K02 TaxID=997761 RepID=I0BIQ8_9BACL|nr:HNH endonuclease [Paenibacillus mucilaginosus]AFH62255.1 HNH endonuclease [Paenibacillus mucilaginosus K02]